MDRIQDILSDLRSPDASIRFAALSRIEETGLSPDEEFQFRSMLEQETDANTRFQMETILARAAAKQKKKEKVGAEEIIAVINDPNRDDIRFTLLLEGVKRTQAEEVSNALRQAKWGEFSPKVLPAILKFFKKYGTKDDSTEIALMCRHDDMRVLTAAIEALEKLNPDLLKPYLVSLLTNPQLGVRARAIRLLSRWDPPEAMRQFESMLTSENTEERNVALFQSFFFPFEQIESLMLRFVSLEKNLELIKRASVVFMSNPDKQVPIKLMEIRQNCEGDKYKLIDFILRGILDSLYKAQLVDAEPAQMLQILEQRFREGKLRLFVEHYAQGLRAQDPNIRFKSAAKLLDAVRANFPGVKELLLKYCQQEPVAAIRERLKPYLEVQTEEQAKEEVKKDYFACSQQERLRIIAKLTPETYLELVPNLINNVQKLSVPELVELIGAIRTIGRTSGRSEEISFVEKCIQNHSPDVIVAAIGCLDELQPFTLHLLLPTLISNPSDDVKIEAIKVFGRFDKQQALSLLEKSLTSYKAQTRRSAIFCLGQFDFPSVSKILFNALKREADPNNLEQIKSILKANPDEEIFINAYVESKRPRNSVKESYEELYKDIIANLVKISGKSEEELYATAEVYAKAEEENVAKKAAYRTEKIQQAQKIRRGEAKEPFWDAGTKKFAIWAYALGAIITAIIWFGFMKPQ